MSDEDDEDYEDFLENEFGSDHRSQFSPWVKLTTLVLILVFLAVAFFSFVK